MVDDNCPKWLCGRGRGVWEKIHAQTAILAPCYLDGKDLIGNDRLERNIEFLRYYRENPLWTILGQPSVFLIDNGSKRSLMAQLGITVVGMDHLAHGPEKHDYPYCWRALYFAQQLIGRGYDKILFIDSDMYILKFGLAKFLGSVQTGWRATWSNTHDFPESSLHVLCRDAFPVFEKYCETPWENRVGTMMEKDLPFTHIDRQFLVDRYGELGAPSQSPNMDAYGQRPLTVPLEFAKFD